MRVDGREPKLTDAGDDFASRVLSLVETIPPGRVMSYGEVAAAIGSRSARGVGQVMAHAGRSMPWWRVVLTSGHPPPGHEGRALAHYEAEGTPLRRTASGSWRVDMPRARHR